MKIITTLFIALCLCAALPADAQNLKLGHVNTQKVLEAMPAYKEAEKKLKELHVQLQQQLQGMQQEMGRLSELYAKDEPTLTDPMKEIRVQEIQDLSKRMEMLQGSAEQQVQQKQSELLKPIEEQVMTAVKTVAKEKGYSYIFDASAGMMLHVPPADDVTDLIKAKLGIQ